MKLQTITFECPPLPNLAVYQQTLGVEGNPALPGVYAPDYNADFGLESTTYPVFDTNGNIRLKINPKKYTRVEVSEGEAKVKDFFSGVYQELRLARVGFDIEVLDFRAPLKFLFQRLKDFQARSVFVDGNWSLIKCWDSVRPEPESFEDGSWVTERYGTITDLKGTEGDGFFKGSYTDLCKAGQPLDDKYYTQPFTISFLEARQRLIQ
jgi:hypothetical protein